MEQAVFGILALGTVVSAAAVVVPPFGRNPVHGALSLVLSFFFLAGLYVLLAAHLVATLQILVYAGAIVVLFLFVIMLLNIRREDLGDARPTLHKLAGIVGIGALVVAAATALAATAQTPAATLAADTDFGTVKRVGQLLYSDFLVPFELTSVLLLAAVVGALVMAKKRL